MAVTTPDFHIRMAARGGLGAVMGSKNLKAVVVDDQGSDRVEVKNKAVLRESVTPTKSSAIGHLSSRSYPPRNHY